MSRPVSAARSYSSGPRPAGSAAAPAARRYCSDAALAMLPACSEIWPRSSDPAFGANSMPRPAPSTVPVSSPITKLPPPPPSFSKRSYPSPMSRLLIPGSWFRVPGSWFWFWFWFLVPVLRGSGFRVLGSPFVRRQQLFDRHPYAAQNADDAAGLDADVRAHPVGRVVHALDRRANRGVHSVGLFLHLRRHALHVVENRVHPGHGRRHVVRLERRQQIRHAPVQHERRDAGAQDDQGFEDADGGHDAEQQIGGSQTGFHIVRP